MAQFKNDNVSDTLTMAAGSIFYKETVAVDTKFALAVSAIESVYIDKNSWQLGWKVWAAADNTAVTKLGDYRTDLNCAIW